MLAQLRQDVTARGRQLRTEIARTRADLRHARDEYHLARAERPRCVARLDGLVARYNGVTLYRDHVQWGRQVKPLVGVRATVSPSPADLGGMRDVRLTVSGPDWEWNIPTVAVLHTRKVRAFAALINSYAQASGDSLPALVG